MKPRGHTRNRGPLNTMPNPRRPRAEVSLEKAQREYDARKDMTQRELLIEAGIITPQVEKPRRPRPQGRR